MNSSLKNQFVYEGDLELHYHIPICMSGKVIVHKFEGIKKNIKNFNPISS